MIAALFVRADGPYANRPDIDAWPETRDARTYPGPFAVVAHPPCKRWSRLASIHQARWPIGSDDGCFASALASVEAWGGVLEHPAGSYAWPAFGLPEPPSTGGWVRSLWHPGWACHVEQGHYGHEARKATWLYAVGIEMPTLRWGPCESATTIEMMPSSGPRRETTPAAFAEALIAMATSVRR